MGLREVKDEILNSAKKESSKLLDEARKESQKIMGDARKTFKKKEESKEKETGKVIENLERMKIAQANSDAQKMILKKKKKVIDSLFSSVQNNLAKISENKKKEVMEKLIDKSKQEIEIDTVYCNKKDMKLLKEFNCQEADITGGIIVENKDKSIRIDYSFELLLSNIKENSLLEIAKILF